MPGGRALLGMTEQAIEDTVRAYPCPPPTTEGTPECGAGVGRPCRANGIAQHMSHTRRYNVAADAGLVPPLLAAPEGVYLTVSQWIELFRGRRDGG